MNKEDVVHIYNRILFSHGFPGGSDGCRGPAPVDPGNSKVDGVGVERLVCLLM